MGAIGWEAIRRFSNPAQWLELRSLVLRWSVAISLLSCSCQAAGRLKHRGAFLHMAADAVVSLGLS